MLRIFVECLTNLRIGRLVGSMDGSSNNWIINMYKWAGKMHALRGHVYSGAL